MDKSRVAVFTRVYRYEECIHKCIESVLNQTYRNIRYYILVSNETLPTVKKYADDDNRIVILQNDEKNNNIGFITYSQEIANDNNDYVCTLDADDYYESNFIENILSYMQVNNLDIGVCGSAFEDIHGKKLAERCIDKNVEWNYEEMPNYFSYVLIYFRPIWGRIFASHVLNNNNKDIFPASNTYGGYGGDTIFNLLSLKYTKRIGILNKVLHHYTIAQNSGSRKFSEGRENSDSLLTIYQMKFLKEFGDISAENMHNILIFYGNGLLDTLALIEKQDNIEMKLKMFKNVINSEITTTFLSLDISNDYIERIFTTIFSPASSLEESKLYEYFELFVLIYKKYKNILTFEDFKVIAIEKINLYYLAQSNYNKLFSSMKNIYEKLPNFRKNIILLLSKLTENLVLKSLLIEEKEKFINKYYELIIFLQEEQYDTLLNIILDVIDNEDEFQLELIDLIISTAAITNNANNFINAIIMKAKYYLINSDEKKADEIFLDLINMGISVDEINEIKDSLK